MGWSPMFAVNLGTGTPEKLLTGSNINGNLTTKLVVNEQMMTQRQLNGPTVVFRQ